MNEVKTVRVLLVDDHPVVRTGVRQYLAWALPGADIAEAGSAREALAMVVTDRWDIVLLDLDLPDRNGLDLLADLRLAAPKSPILVVSGLPENEIGLQVLRAGAAGFCAKISAPEELAKAVVKVLETGRYTSPGLADLLAAAAVRDDGGRVHEGLSPREMQILLSIAAGRSVGEIAEQLSLSVKTVSTYRTRLLAKMDMESTAELMRYGIKHGLVR
jgi:DNA-binding NarL/FixJ family response regulator